MAEAEAKTVYAQLNELRTIYKGFLEGIEARNDQHAYNHPGFKRCMYGVELEFLASSRRLIFISKNCMKNLKN